MSNWKFKKNDLVRTEINGIEIDRKVKHVLPDEDNRPLYILEQCEKPFREHDLELVVRADPSGFVEITQAEYAALKAAESKLAAVEAWVSSEINEARSVWKSINSKNSDPLVQNLFHRASSRLATLHQVREQLAAILDAEGEDE